MILLQLQIIILEDKNCGFVVITTTVVGRGEDRDHVGEGVFAAPLVHFESFALNLMPAENTEQLVAFKQLLNWFLAEVIGALALGVVLELVVWSVFVVHGVGPQQITENTVERNLLESI